MKCGMCGADMKSGVTTDVKDYGSSVIIIRNVPCYKCTECGEVFYNIETVKHLELLEDEKQSAKSEIFIANYKKVA